MNEKQLDELLQSLRSASVQALFLPTQTEATNAIIGIRSKIMGDNAALAAEVTDLRAALTEANQHIEALEGRCEELTQERAEYRVALQEIKHEPVLAAWTANKFREIAAAALRRHDEPQPPERG